MAALALLLALAVSAAEPDPTVTLSAVGDIRLDGPIAAIAKSDGPDAPTAKVKALLAADIVFGNLETPVTTRGTKTPKTWNFRARPELLPILRAAGFTVLNIANNHVWDYGREGFEDTLKHLSKGPWAFIGGGDNRDEAEEVRVIEKNGLKIGFVGLTSTHPEEAWARDSKPGIAYSNFGRLPGIVARAKKQCDVLVVSFHGGTELAEDANEIQKAVAHAVIDAGADLFLGHHPHVLQAVELRGGKPILYSLGNFLFVSPTPTTRPTVVARFVLGREGVRRLELIPVDGNYGRLRPADAEVTEAARAALDRLGAFAADSRIVFGKANIDK